jgi:hypothetical protein
MSLAVGLGVASLAGQVIGNVLGGSYNRATQNLLNKQVEDNESFYNRNVNQNFLNTNAAKGMFEQLRKNVLDANKTVDSTAAVTGATPEATIAAKSKNQENYNDAVNNLSQQATGYQQNQEAIFRGEKARLTDQQINLNTQRAEAAANVAGNASDVMSAAATLPGFDNAKTVIPQTGNAVINARTPEQNAELNRIAGTAFIPKSEFRV